MSIVEAAPPKFTWTEENVARLRELRNQGYSCSVIARELDPAGYLTRNAVIGKQHRLGLLSGSTIVRFRKPPAQWRVDQIEQFRVLHGQGWSGESIAKMVGMSVSAVYTQASRLGLSFKASAAKRRREQPPRSRAAMRDLPVEHKPDAMLLVDLEDHHCRWPVGGSGRDTLYCGAATDRGAYCAAHHDRSVS